MKKGGAQRRLAWSELDQRFGARSVGLWRFYLRELRLPELRFTPDGGAAAALSGGEGLDSLHSRSPGMGR